MRFIRVLLFMAVSAWAVATAAAHDEPAGLTREEIESLVRDYLVENPEVVIEALQAWERRAAEQNARDTRAAIESHADELLHDPETPVGGDPSGEIVIVEFFDYRCGYCRRNAPDVFALRDTVPGVKLIYKEFPILGEASLLAARAALAARAQGLYEPFHEALMTVDTGFSLAEIMDLAETTGLDPDRLREDMADPAIENHIDRTHDLARALGINGTPAFIVNGELYPGALSRDRFEEILAAAP